MTLKTAILSIDQGTTSTRAIIFDEAGASIATSQIELPQHYPQSGWVEHDAAEIWQHTKQVCANVIDHASAVGYAPHCIGITNQRETTVIWDRQTGTPIHNAIVWQDRRTADQCQKLRDAGHEELVASRTGLLLDPYFSATKIAWILDEIDGARAGALAGKLAFGTIDSFLLWHLTGGVHATEATNASRTALFDIHKQEWDAELLDLFNIPASILPEVRDSAADFGVTSLFGDAIPITGMAGDQQAATFGQACFNPGMIKSTYGTGCFVLLNTGEQPIRSSNQLLTTTAYRLDGIPTYALEGSIFVAGAAVQWLRDELGLIADSAASEIAATSVADNGGVYMVPAFTGLGAPWWDPEARGTITGLTRDSSAAHIVRATLESAGYQTNDLLAALERDWTDGVQELRVDGGMAENDWLMQFLADICNVPVNRPTNTETTALGAAYLAGLQTGIWSSLDELAKLGSAGTSFTPNMNEDQRTRLLGGWSEAVGRTLSRTA